MEKISYRPSDISKSNEDSIKRPLSEEHNIMGAKFDTGKISKVEWKSFLKDWHRRFDVAINNVVKNRTYVEEIIIEDIL
jgi:hypothetical protein